MKSAAGYPLELRYEGAIAGYRHYLNGRPVLAGTTLELLTDDGWVRGRYEWSFRTHELPALHLANQIILLDADALLLWPGK